MTKPGCRRQQRLLLVPLDYVDLNITELDDGEQSRVAFALRLFPQAIVCVKARYPLLSGRLPRPPPRAVPFSGSQGVNRGHQAGTARR